jgi:hypothetical protein
MMRTARRRQPSQDFHGSFLKQWGDRAPLRTDVVEAQLGRAFASDHDEIHPIRQKLGPRTEALPAEALHTVATHRGPDTPCHDHPQARGARRGGLRRDQHREVGGPDPAT